VKAAAIVAGARGITIEVAGSGEPWRWVRGYESLEERDVALGELAAIADWAAPRLATVELDASLVQRRSVKGLPPVRDRALQGIIELQRNKLFRKGSSLVVSSRWKDRARTTAEAVAADPEWLDALARGLVDAGSQQVVFRTASGLELRSPWQEATGYARRVRIHKRLAAAAIALWVSAAAVYGARLVATDRALAAELAQLEPAARSLAAAHRDIDQAARAVALVESSLRHRKALPSLLSKTLTALPDSAFVERIVLDMNGQGVLAGASQSPALLLDRLSAVPGLRPPELRDGATVEPEGGTWQVVAIALGKAEA